MKDASSPRMAIRGELLLQRLAAAYGPVEPNLPSNFQGSCGWMV
jgi:hypothetical protein